MKMKFPERRWKQPNMKISRIVSNQIYALLLLLLYTSHVHKPRMMNYVHRFQYDVIIVGSVQPTASEFTGIRKPSKNYSTFCAATAIGGVLFIPAFKYSLLLIFLLFLRGCGKNQGVIYSQEINN